MCVCLGEKEIPGLTDKTIPRRLGPKRATKIRKLFNLAKDDDVRKWVVRRPLPERTRVTDNKVEMESARNDLLEKIYSTRYYLLDIFF